MFYTPLQTREIFHLIFLQEFLRKFDPKFVVLKGGVNLRFFFKSCRYSEDMDLDVQTASLLTLQKNVLKTFERIAFPLKAYGITEVISPSMKHAKQTETTQRFKVHLKTRQGLDLFTKIEFSRRGIQDEAKFERVEEGILRNYRLSPVVVQHYTASSAFEQKILALAGRAEVQSRDVYDLYQLLSFLPQDFVSSVSKEKLQKAIHRTQEISYLDYRESVVAYLTEEDQRALGLEEVWREIQTTVVQAMEKGREVP